jgi:hypothetical protein
MMQQMADNPVAIEDVRDFFAAVLARDAAALQRIEASAGGLELRSEGLVFSLPALHAALDPGQSLAYRDFRKLLYASTLNQELSAFDAEVTLFRSSGKTDTSLYCLRQKLEP